LTDSRLRYGPAMTPDHRPNPVRSFERHLRAENRSEHTIASYLESLRQAEAFLGELLQRRAPETVATRYRRLRVLYRWLEEEEEIPAGPMARMKPPIVPDQFWPRTRARTSRPAGTPPS
jgi:site-specific recombinase XerD